MASVSSLTGDTTSGSTLFTSNCASCHGANATGGSGPNLVGQDETTVIEAVLSGPDEMPAFTALTDQQIADITAFVVQL